MDKKKQLEKWNKTLEKIKADLTPISYDTWFKPLVFNSVDETNKIIYFEVFNALLVKVINERYELLEIVGSGGMATGIAVQILDAQSQQEIPLNQVQPLTPLKAGDNTLKYQLRYKSTKAGATGGNATAVLYFDLVYQ